MVRPLIVLLFLFALVRADAARVCEFSHVAFSRHTETILDQNGLAIGDYWPVTLDKQEKYRDSSLLRANYFSRGAQLPIDGVDAGQRIAAALAPNDPSRAAKIREYVGKAQGRGLRSLPFLDFYPKEIRETGYVDCDGPNCFNTAARFNLPHLPRGELYPAEKIPLLQKEFVQLKPGEKLQPGDELVIWMPPANPAEGPYRIDQIDPESPLWRGRLLHSMIFVDPWTVYHKGSDLKDSPIGFETITSAMRLYDTWRPVITVHRKKPGAAPPAVQSPRVILAQ